MYNNGFFHAIKMSLFVLLVAIISYTAFNTLVYNLNYNKNITTEIKVGKIIDSYKENIQGLFGGNIKYETAIKVDDEIIISKDEKIYYEAIDKIGKEVKVEVKNDKNIDKKSIVDIK